MKSKAAKAVHANRGIEARYRQTLQGMIDEMCNSVVYWTKANYNKAPPAVAGLVTEAEDSSPAADMRRGLRRVGKQWLRRFNESAPVIASNYVTRMFKATDSAMRKSMLDAGWAVEFRMNAPMRDALQASIGENVGLIKSIPGKYLEQVEGIVMRSYSAGRDLATMTEELKALYPKASDRATLIARDQSNKANAVVNRTRQLELGISEAIWMHSHGGKEPRPDHVAANGKRYKIAEGCYISGEYIQPGQLINCRCTSRPILPTN